MSETTKSLDTLPPTDPGPALRKVDADALRVVLFGMPSAGKSSLLGALMQASQTQTHLLTGRLTDLSGGLSELQKRLYEDRPKRTAVEVAPYLVEFEPFSQEGQTTEGVRKNHVLLIDCDGQVANDLLQKRQGLSPDGADGALALDLLPELVFKVAVEIRRDSPRVQGAEHPTAIRGQGEQQLVLEEHEVCASLTGFTPPSELPGRTGGPTDPACREDHGHAENAGLLFGVEYQERDLAKSHRAKSEIVSDGGPARLSTERPRRSRAGR